MPDPVEPPVIDVAVATSAPVESHPDDPPPPPTDPDCPGVLLRAEQHTASGKADASLYVEALHARDDGLRQEERKTLLTLVENHKRSPLVPYAYVLFAEGFYAEAERDPSRWPIAENFYREAIKYPADGNNESHFYAQFKLGEVYRAQDRLAKAISAFDAVIERGDSHPDERCIKTLAADACAARRAIVARHHRLRAKVTPACP